MEVTNTRKRYISSRLILCILGTIGCGLIYSLRINLSVAIVAMVNHTSLDDSLMNDFDQPDEDICYIRNNTDMDTEEDYPRGSLLWDPALQGIVLGAYFYGYTVTQILGGRFAEKWGAKLVCGLGLTIPAIANALTPLAAEFHESCVIIIRIIIGAFHGLVFSALFTMYVQWFPKKERTSAFATTIFGANLGGGITTILAGYLCKNGFANGWPSVYYSTSAIHLIWLIFWVIFAFDTPEKDPRISSEEKIYIWQNMDASNIDKNTVIPWKSILKSPVVYASAIAKVTGNFAYFFLAAKLPTYLDGTFGIKIESNGLFNAFVYFGLSITMIISGPLSDLIHRKTNISLTIIRKGFQTFAMLGPALCLAMIPIVGCDQTAVIILMILSMGSFGFQAGGEYPMIPEYAAELSGTVFGIANTIGSLSGFLSPMIAGIILESKSGSVQSRWNKAFYIAAGVNAFGIIIFDIFASAERQSWAKLKDNNDMTNDNKNCSVKIMKRKPQNTDTPQWQQFKSNVYVY